MQMCQTLLTCELKTFDLKISDLIRSDLKTANVLKGFWLTKPPDLNAAVSENCARFDCFAES